MKYDYGLYKVAILSSLIWLPVLFVGIQGIVIKFEGRKRVLASVASCLLVLSLMLFVRFENKEIIPYQADKEIKSYEQIQGLTRIVGNRPVVLACNNDF